MKRFEELNEREQRSKNQLELRTLFSKRNICIGLICVVISVVLSLLWSSSYESYQRKKIEKWQQETANNLNNYTISWDWGNATTEPNDTIDKNEESQYKDLEIEFAGAEKFGSEGLTIYTKINNPNDQTISIRSTGIYFNNVCIDDLVFIESVVGNKETYVNFLASYTAISANQVGDNITEFSMQYNFDGETDKIREAKDEGFSYKIGDISVNRGNQSAETVGENSSVINDSTIENANKETVKMFEDKVVEGPNGINVKLVKTENLSDKYKFYFLITNSSDTEQQFLIPTGGSYYDDFEVYTSVGEAVPSYRTIPAGNSMSSIAYINKSKFTDIGLSGFDKAEICMKVREGKEGDPQTFKFEVSGLNVTVDEQAENVENSVDNETVKIFDNKVIEGPNGINVKLVKTENLPEKYKFYFLITNSSDTDQQFLIPTDGSYYDGFEVYTSIGEAVPSYRTIPAGNSMSSIAYINKSKFTDIGLSGFDKAEIRMKVREGKEGEPQTFKFEVDGLDVTINQ